MSVRAAAAERLDAIRAAGTYRRMRVLAGAQGPRMRVDGRDVVLLAGSNYLDLACHPEVTAAAAEAALEHGCAAGGSRLITGNLELHESLEAELAHFLKTESALAFNTGYMANLGIIPALAGRGDVVVSDELNHASIIDGCRLSQAGVRVFRHADLDHLEEVLRDAAERARRVLLIVDGVYSMDGNVAPLREMVPLAKRFGAMVVLDDAHGVGTLGVGGRGSAEVEGVEAEVDAVVGTLGKSLGSFGAFVAGSHALRDLLVNTARSFIFSCALAPPQVAAARVAVELIEREPWRRERLQQRAARLRERLAEHGIATGRSSTHILPVLVGDNERVMQTCDALLERGFYAQGIRHPTVPAGTERLRVTTMASHEEHELDAFADACAELLAAPAAGVAAG